MKMQVFDKFYKGLYERSWKIHTKHRFLSKIANFFQLEASLMKKEYLFFSSLQGKESLCKFSCLDPVQ